MSVIVKPTLFLVASLFPACSNGGLDYRRSIERIAHEISRLKDSHPQLRDFSVAEHLKVDKLQISYGYHTHKPTGRGGWTSSVPNPDDDGIWFYIDFHSPESTLQIHTQPAGIPYCVGGMRLSFLSLEGANTKSAEGAIWEILTKHGATKCDKRLASSPSNRRAIPLGQLTTGLQKTVAAARH